MEFKKLLTNRLFVLLILFTLIYVVCAVSFGQYKDVWWDSASYMGYGKYLFSHGSSGVFEPMKPVLLPIILGIIMKIGLNVVVFGKIAIFLLSLFSLVFIYLITKELFNEKAAFIAGILTFCNPLFFVFTFRIYTEMLSICFILGAVYFMIKNYKTKKNVFLIFSALFCALAFMSKNPNALVAVILDVFFLIQAFKRKEIKPLVVFNIALLIFIIPFFIIGNSIGGSPLYLYQASQQYFRENLGHLYDLGAFPGISKIFFWNTTEIYFKTILYLLNIILPFSLIGMFNVIRNRKDEDYLAKNLLIVVPTVVLFLFFEIFYLKSERYILPVMPLLTIFAAIELKKIKDWQKWTIIVAYFVIGIVWASIFLNSSYNSEAGYRDFFINPPIKIECKNVATSDPRSLLKYDKVFFPYEVYDRTWTSYLVEKNNPQCVFYYSCYENRSDQIGRLLELNYSLKYDRDNGKCRYSILSK